MTKKFGAVVTIWIVVQEFTFSILMHVPVFLAWHPLKNCRMGSQLLFLLYTEIKATQLLIMKSYIKGKVMMN